MCLCEGWGREERKIEKCFSKNGFAWKCVVSMEIFGTSVQKIAGVTISEESTASPPPESHVLYEI